MKCDELRTLHGPCLDSELDAKTTLEIEQHLETCPACARRFSEEGKLEAQVMAGLNRGPRTASLWEQIERSVSASASSASRPWPLARVSQSAGWRAALGILSDQLRAGWQRSRWAWTGLAAGWAVILALNFSAREPNAPLVAGREAPSVSEVRVALQQQRMLMVELALTSDPAPADKPKPVRPSPRSDRRSETLNA